MEPQNTAPDPAADSTLADRASRVAIGGLFVALAVRIGADFVETMRVTGLLLLASEGLVALLTLARRRAVRVDRSWEARVVTAISLAGPPLLLPSAGWAPLADAQAAIISACGLAIVVAGKISLGRSFGVVPANRGVVSSGIYRIVRHPIYVGYFLTHVAFILSHLDWWNVGVLLVSDAMLVVRAAYEERTLIGDPRYVAYRSSVRWRMLPGVY